MNSGIKIFSMNDCDWVAARSLEEAKKYYREKHWSGDDSDQTVFDDPHELDGSAMNRLQFSDDDGSKRTFAAQLALLIAQGQEFPCFFASTEY